MTDLGHHPVTCQRLARSGYWCQSGHDRTIINIKPEHVGAWLNPEPADLAALYQIFDDKRHPFYERQIAA